MLGSSPTHHPAHPHSPWRVSHHTGTPPWHTSRPPNAQQCCGAVASASIRPPRSSHPLAPLAVYNRQRVPLIKSLKEDSNVWVSKYARGGSVRKVSARKMYIAVDAVQGHLASAG